MTAALEWRDVSKRYGAVRALDRLSLEVRPGEVFGFLGPNGAGKTTAIRIAAGLLRTDEGEVFLGGAPAGRPESRRRVGYLPEDIRLPARHRLGEWLACQLRLRGVDGARIPAVAERVGLAGRLDTETGALSKGMRRRAGLMLMIAVDPALWLLDEPTADLDVPGRELVENVILEARSRGASFFLSSHILSEVERVCDRVGLIERGRLARTAAPAELLPAPFLVDATFHETPPEPERLLEGRTFVEDREARRIRVFVRDREDGDRVLRLFEEAGSVVRQSTFRSASLRDSIRGLLS
ncbi:MAG: ABC transporter ATP-binding protein [Candidatus Eisenbacteria bacterium]|nr:ABC transporter ATP-binding protein [Candidatus Eisenbacteria bacterium]